MLMAIGGGDARARDSSAGGAAMLRSSSRSRREAVRPRLAGRGSRSGSPCRGQPRQSAASADPHRIERRRESARPMDHGDMPQRRLRGLLTKEVRNAWDGIRQQAKAFERPCPGCGIRLPGTRRRAHCAGGRLPSSPLERGRASTGGRGELLGSGWLDSDQYWPEHRVWRSGCQPKYRSTTACHWFSSGYRQSSRRDP